jgi:diguanylate cyclase (GGDEF)-like protein
VVVDPKHRIRNDLIPPVILETVVADGVTRPFSGDLAIPPGMKAIEFHYTALSFRVPGRVRFKYQLEGYDHEWVEAGSRRVAYYTNLSPGKYRFRVIASNDDGVWNERGASVNIRLEPRFYQTQFFFFACLLLAILMVLGANRLNTRLIRNRAALLKRLVDERTEELRKSQRELEQLALFDTLTALPNRRMFAKDFSRMYAQPEGGRFSLLLVDVDNFKAINDTFGHDAGDAYLVEASNRLGAAVRSSDRVARLGGDEFAILLSGEHEKASIEKICDRILQSFTAALDYRGVDILTGVSIGIASFPEHADTQENLYKAADLALYEAKRRGRNNWCWYRAELEGQIPCGAS